MKLVSTDCASLASIRPGKTANCFGRAQPGDVSVRAQLFIKKSMGLGLNQLESSRAEAKPEALPTNRVTSDKQKQKQNQNL